MVANEAANAGRKNDGEQADRESVHGVPEKKRYSLDYADLDRHESKPDEQKKERARADQPAGYALNRRQRRQHNGEHHQHERQRNDESSTIVAPRLPLITPESASIARSIDAGS